MRLGLAWGHFEDKKFFLYTTVKDLSLDVYDDIHVLHLVSDSQRSLFSQELTPTLTLGLSLSLGLGSAWGHLEDKKFCVYTNFEHFSLVVYDDIHVLHLVSDFERLSFSQELTSTLTLRLSLRLGLVLSKGHIEDKKFLIYTTLKDFSLDVYDNIHVLHLVSDSQRLSFSQELTPSLTLGLSLRLGLGLA